MRLVIAQCTVDYLGRLTAHLPSARRLLLVKADGSVSIHADDRAYKPLNWMSPPCWLTEAEDGRVWLVENKSESNFGSPSRRSSTTPAMNSAPTRVWSRMVWRRICRNCSPNTSNCSGRATPVRREYMTAIGPVDILCRDADGRAVAVEIKRRGEIDGVGTTDPLPGTAQP